MTLPVTPIAMSARPPVAMVPPPGPNGQNMDPRAGQGTPVIEIYGTQNWDPNAQMSGSSSTAKIRLERNLSDALGQKVFIEAQGIPRSISLTSFGNVSTDSALRDVALNHIQEQTGLTWTELSRDVHTLVIEAKKPGGP